VLVGVTGEDAVAETLRAALAARGLDRAHLVADGTRRTTQKTRIIAHHQQVVRADQEDTAPIAPAVAAALERAITAALPAAGALVISDYGKGVVERDFLVAVLGRAAAAGVPVCVDPKESHFDAYRAVSVITPNLMEAGNACGRRITDEKGLEEAGFELLARLGCGAVLITRSEQGMSLFEPPAEHTHSRPRPRRCMT